MSSERTVTTQPDDGSSSRPGSFPAPLSLSSAFVRTLIALCFLGSFSVMSWLNLHADAPTSDEGVHLAAGLSYLQTGDHRMNPEHPPLAKLVAALPLWAKGIKLPLEHPAWAQGQEWTFGAAFLYRNTLSPDRLLELGRLPILLLSLLLLVLVWRTAHRLYGPAGGLLALALMSFEPTLLAHGHYITNDALLALGYLATLLCLSRYHRSQAWLELIGSGVLVGLTLGTKFSGLLVLPFVWWLTLPPAQEGLSKLERLRKGLGRSLVVSTLAYLVLALVYQSEPLRPYLEGIAGMQQGWNAFLMGEISSTGFYRYFVYALLLKLPPATLLCIGLALLTVRSRALRAEEAVLLIAALWFLLVSSVLRINIGIRHILPALPLLMILAGRLTQLELPRPRRMLVVIALPLLTLLEVGWTHPYALSYFSSVVGGPAQGYRYLSDSNLDWGQDFKRLAAWAREQAPEGMLLGVFFGGDPAAYGVRYQPVPGFGALGFRERPLESLPPRILLAMSSLNLQGVYFTPDGPFQSDPPPTPELYHFLLEREPLLRLTPSIWIWDLSQDAEALQRLAMIQLHFGWTRSAIGLLRRYLGLKPEDQRTAAGLERILRELN